MKPALRLIPPALALATAALWLGARQREIGGLERETIRLHGRLSAARAATAGTPSPADPRPAAEPRGGKVGGGWQAVAASLDGGDFGTTMKLRARLFAMSVPELLTALDEVATLDLAGEAGAGLERMLVGVLAEKDPRAALERCAERIGEVRGDYSWLLAGAFQRWAGIEPDAALAWLDARIAAGGFDAKSLDGKSTARLRFEAGLVRSMLAGDPAAAARRIAALPEDQRLALFQQGAFTRLQAGTEQAFATLVRGHLPADQQAAALSGAVPTLLLHGGYPAVDGFLDGIDATPDERRALAGKAAADQLEQLGKTRRIGRDDVDAMRAWLARQAPGAVDRITGETLGNPRTGRTPAAELARIVGELHAENGGDELLLGFLGSPAARREPELARSLADKLDDPAKRAEILGELDRKTPPAIRPAALR